MRELAKAVSELFTAATRLSFGTYTAEPKWQSTICLAWVGTYDDDGFHGPRDGVSLSIGRRGYAVFWR